MDWNKLLSNARRKDRNNYLTGIVDTFPDTSAGMREKKGSRHEFERDYDRVLFLAPTRRLADKTQVFPLEQNDSVRNRLTHSHEVCNLARSIGVQLAYEEPDLFAECKLKERGGDITRCLPSLLAAIGLAHDLGNPPFGHRGEDAIQEWFRNNIKKFENVPKEDNYLLEDFLKFDGNAQTLRLLTKLQILNDKFGVNLTYGTLAALIKYPQSNQFLKDNKNQQWKKHGYFYSEREIVKEVWEETGLAEGIRHPLTYVMEACDDIAYSVLDAEDIVKKGLASFHDLISHLNHWIETKSLHKSKNNTQHLMLIKDVVKKSQRKHKEFANPDNNLTPSELNDVSMQMFRVYAIGELIKSITDAFTANIKVLTTKNEQPKDLLPLSEGNELCEALKSFDKKWGYKNNSVLKLELRGYNYITRLMDMLWIGIHGRLNENDTKESKSFFGEYVYGRISENYRRVFEDKDNGLPDWYKEAQLLTDAISGMTDSYLISLHDELLGLLLTQ